MCAYVRACVRFLHIREFIGRGFDSSAAADVCIRMQGVSAMGDNLFLWPDQARAQRRRAVAGAAIESSSVGAFSVQIAKDNTGPGRLLYRQSMPP